MDTCPSVVSLWRMGETRALAGATFVGFSGLFLTLACLSSYAVSGGASDSYAGLVITALLATTVATQVFVTALIRQIGEVRAAVLGLVLLGLPSPLYLVSHEFWPLVAVSIIRGTGFGIVAVVCSLLAAQIAPTERLGEALGIYGLSIATASVVCVPIGVALTASGNFAIVAGLALCPLLGAPLVLRVAQHANTRRTTGSAQAVDRRQAIRASLLPAVLLTVVTLAGGGLTTFLPIERPHGPMAALTLFVFGLAGGITRWQAGSAADRFGLRRLLPGGIGLAAIGLFVLALGLRAGGGGDAVVLLAAAVFGAGYGAIQNLTLVMTFDRVEPDAQAIGSSIWNGAFDAGTSVGALAVGAVAATGLGVAWTLACCAALIAATAPLMLRGRAFGDRWLRLRH
jgi:predicted MFS family arabinose efflux permease